MSGVRSAFLTNTKAATSNGPPPRFSWIQENGLTLRFMFIVEAQSASGGSDQLALRATFALIFTKSICPIGVTLSVL